jgi:hypothetical protein
MAEALGFDPPARLIEQNPPEEMLPLQDDEAVPEPSGEVQEAEK